jgi:hypothetical protein
MYCLLAFSIAAHLRASQGASQGFYLLAPQTAQLFLTDLSGGAQTPIGDGLPLGWAAPSDCTPTASEQTGKWLYTFARASGSPAGAPWSVLAMEMRDGSLRKVYNLPNSFPPALPACAHAVAEDGGWHAYVAAVTRDADPRLIMWRFTFTWPFSNESVPILDVPVASLGLGAAPPTLSLAVSNFTAWLALEKGLIGVDLATRAPSRRLPLPGGVAVGLQYDVAGAPRRVVGLLVGASATSLFSFVDTGGGVPGVESTPTARVAPGAAGWAALANDKGAYVVVGAGRAVVIALDGGAVLGNFSACGSGGACPIACAYVSPHPRLRPEDTRHELNTQPHDSTWTLQKAGTSRLCFRPPGLLPVTPCHGATACACVCVCAIASVCVVWQCVCVTDIHLPEVGVKSYMDMMYLPDSRCQWGHHERQPTPTPPSSGAMARSSSGRSGGPPDAAPWALL